PQFGPRASVRYDARTYRLMSLGPVSLTTLEGRVVCQLLLGARQRDMLVDALWEVGGAALVWRRSVDYLHITRSRETPDEPEHAPDGGVLGVDLGIVNPVNNSDGEPSGTLPSPSRENNGPRSIGLWRHPARGSCKPPA